MRVDLAGTGSEQSLMRLGLIAGAVLGVVLAVAALLLGGGVAAAMAVLGAALGWLNLWTAAGALRKAPALFIGASLPRLAIVTVILVVLVAFVGERAIWAVVGLILMQLTEVALVLRLGLRMMAK